MPINYKRRIFRPAAFSLRGAVPGRATVLVVLAGMLTFGTGAWLLLRPSQAPARSPATGHIGAAPMEIAVLDGATLRVHERVIRLAGILPPARGEACQTAAGAGFDCGVAATNALAALVQKGPLDCTLHGHDDMGRPLAMCRWAGGDLNMALVRAGWAHAEGGEPDMAAAETQARDGRRGLWGDGRTSW